MAISQKQKQFLKDDLPRMTIVEGCISSGKTFIANHKAIEHISTNYIQQGLIFFVGRTLKTLERNVLEPLVLQYGNNFKYSTHQKKANLCGMRIELEGCNDVTAEAKIRGSTAEFIYGDELTLWNEAFLTRCMGSLRTPNACFLGTTNPDKPSNFVKINFLDRQKELGLNNPSFNMQDNPSLTPEYIEQVSREYQGVFHDRFIKGLWVSAEGVIYPLFAENTDQFIVDEVNERLMIVTIGVDYGASASKTTFRATGITHGYKNVYILDEYDIKGVHTPEEIYKHFIKFYMRVYGKYKMAQYTFADYGALGQVITQGLYRKCQQERIPTKIEDCTKGKILDRIFLSSQLMAQGRLKILRKNKVTIKAFQDAVWNSKVPDERLDDGTSDIDSLDAFEYSIQSFYDKLIDAGRLQVGFNSIFQGTRL